MKLYFIFTLLIISSVMYSQRAHVSPEGMEFEIKDAIWLDSNDGGITPILASTSGYRPFKYNWFGPNDFVSNDSVLTNVDHGEYSLRISDTLCGTYLTTVEVLAVNNEYKKPNDLKINYISPNPFIDNVRLGLESQRAGVVFVRVLNNKGRLSNDLKYDLIIGAQELDLGEIGSSSGIYIIQICDENNCQITKRLVKIE